MADDIVERLHAYSPATCAGCDTWGQCGYGEPCDCTCHRAPHLEAAAEIERLRAAGDALDEAISGVNCAGTPEIMSALMEAHGQWLEARRG